MTDEIIQATAELQPISIAEMRQQAPDLFRASPEFLLIEPYLAAVLK